MSSSALFRPIQIGKLTIPNRIVMPAMGLNVAEGGIPSKAIATYYRQRAEGGVGLIMTEGVFIDHPASGNHELLMRFNGDAALEGWGLVSREVHEAGGLIMPELWHVGINRPNYDMMSGERTPYDPRQVGPSGYMQPGEQVMEGMSQRQIDEVIESFVRGALNAKRLGFDGVELHGAHGFLIDQFFWHETNHRTDGYGGSMRNRARFAAEIIAEVRRATGPDFPICIRLSQWKLSRFDAEVARDPQELEDWLGPLVDAGVDAFDCSQRRFWEPLFAGSSLNFAGWARKLTGKPCIAVGSVGLDKDLLTGMAEFSDPGQTKLNLLLEMMNEDAFDMIAVGRALIADPNWARKVQQQRYDELLPFTMDILRQSEYLASYENN